MNEIEAIRWHLHRYRAILAQQIDRLNNALEELQRTTLFLMSLGPDQDENIDAWLQAEGFAVDEDGFFQSMPLIDAFRKGIAPSDSISFSWGQDLRTDSQARRHMYSHRAIGFHLKHIHDRLKDVGWIYYQDAGNTALQYPYIDQRTAISSDFDWRTYHTYLSVCPENNPERQIQWTAPTVDYAGEGLILSVSIPVWRNDVFIGLWSIDLPIRYLYRDFALTKPFPDQMQFIVNKKGMLLLHDNLLAEIDQPKGQVFLHSLSELGGQWAELELDAIFKKEGDVLPMTDVAGKKWIFCQTHVPGVEWTFFCGLPELSMEKFAVEGLRQGFQQVGGGNFSYRVESSFQSYCRLVEEFNEMSRRLSQAEEHRAIIENQLRGAQKMEAIGKLCASIAHEVNNPLQGIMSVLKGVKNRAILDDEDRNLMDAAISESNRIRDLIRNLQDFNRPSSGKKVVMNIHRSLDSLLLLHKSDFNGKNISVVLDYTENLPPIMAVQDQLIQVFLNLLINAADACQQGGVITVSTRQQDDQVIVAIKDTGIGIKPEEMDQIFNPFFSTKPEVKGTGLGLSVSYGIIKQHQGEIRVESKAGKGATFMVLLPLEEKNAGSYIF